MELRKGNPGCIIYALNCLCLNGATIQDSSLCVSIQYCLYPLHLRRRVPWIATPKIYSQMLIVYASLAIPFTVFQSPISSRTFTLPSLQRSWKPCVNVAVLSQLVFGNMLPVFSKFNPWDIWESMHVHKLGQKPRKKSGDWRQERKMSRGGSKKGRHVGFCACFSQHRSLHARYT